VLVRRTLDQPVVAAVGDDDRVRQRLAPATMPEAPDLFIA